MAGLDDAGMDRADRDDVNALALDRQELRLWRFAPGAGLPDIGPHDAMVEPGPVIDRALGRQAQRSWIMRSKRIAGRR